MIITCPCNKKKFTIDDSLIPVEGRNLKCGTCDRVWFYKIENKTAEPLDLKEDIEKKVIEPNENNVSNSSNSELFEAKLNQKLDKNIKKVDIIQNIDLPKKSKKSKKITFSKFLSYIIVSIISFAVFVILIDTLKTPLINIFPGLEILLFNLFETLQDIKLFIIDLS
tara:strand:- start:333 stop:833 length:501 start_codon:yes stop_codon:yes gene_type:complete